MPRERRDFNRISGVRDPSLIIIAAEGEKTEFKYFTFCRNEFHDSRVKLHFLERDIEKKSWSSPEHVLDQLNQYASENGIKSTDEYCLVIDIDSWPEAQLSAVAQICAQKGYLLTVSNPCFELWILLHIIDIENDFDTSQLNEIFENKDNHIKQLLHNYGGYDLNGLNIEKFKTDVQQAIIRARKFDSSPEQRWPQYLCTRVYRLMEKLPLD